MTHHQPIPLTLTDLAQSDRLRLYVRVYRERFGRAPRQVPEYREFDAVSTNVQQEAL